MKNLRPSFVRRLGRWVVPALLGGLAGLVVGQYSEHAISPSLMLRDDRVLEQLTSTEQQRLLWARPQDTYARWHPEGLYAYNDGESIPVVEEHFGHGCPIGSVHRLCGAGSGLRPEPRMNPNATIDGGFAFGVIDGELVSYSAGAVRDNPQAFRQSIRHLAAQQASLFNGSSRF